MIRGVILIAFITLFAFSFAVAENHTESEIEETAELGVGAGITPDSNLYFIEKSILTRLRDDLENREKKVAEIEAMIKEGKIDDAKTSLEEYNKYVERVGDDVDPAKSEEAKRSASAISRKIAELESEIPESDKEDFVNNIQEKEKSIMTAAELSAKIKELCETLAEVDPNKYAEVCRTDDSSPKWHKDLDKRLTEEQKKEAREFEKIMLQCMQTEGRECRCEDISIRPFAEKCSLVAPLATKCDEGDEEACEIMNEATEDMEDLLPPNLQEVLFITEEKIRGEQLDHFMPPECKKAGVKSPEECMLIMFRENAPEECVKALEEGRIDIKNERDARKQCEEIMFKENAPEECIEAGIKNGKECGTYMCENNLPEECKTAGLTCEQPNKVFRKCDEIMKAQRDGDQFRGEGFGPGRNCMEIQDKDEKLKCFEETFSNVQQAGFPRRGPEHFGEDFRGEGKGSFPQECIEAGIDGSGKDDGERCRQLKTSQGEERRKQTRDFQENFARDCRAKGGAWDCSYGDIDSSNPCRCYVEERRDFGPPRGESNYPREDYRPENRPSEWPQPPQGQPPQGCFDSTGQPIPCQAPGPTPTPGEQTQPTPTSPETTQQPTPSTTESSGTSGTESQSGSTSTSGSSSSTQSGDSGTSGTTSGEGSGITGGVIMSDNRFIDYYFKF